MNSYKIYIKAITYSYLTISICRIICAPDYIQNVLYIILEHFPQLANEFFNYANMINTNGSRKDYLCATNFIAIVDPVESKRVEPSITFSETHNSKEFMDGIPYKVYIDHSNNPAVANT